VGRTRTGGEYATTKSSLPAAARTLAAALLVKLASTAAGQQDEAWENRRFSQTLAEAARAVEVLAFLKGAPVGGSSQDHEVGLLAASPPPVSV